jgi:hypothetical protein
MPRHSAKLPDAGVAAAWSLDLADGVFADRLAAVLRRHLGAADAARVAAFSEIVADYVGDTELEGAAVPAAEVAARIAELRAGAAAFWRALEAPRSDANAAAESLIGQAGEHRRALGFGPLIGLMADFVTTCDGALGRLDAVASQSHFVPGEAWVRFVARLADGFEASGRRASAAKGARRASAFVGFAFAVQSLLPPRFWRHPVATPNTVADAAPSATFGEAVARALAARNGRARSQPRAKNRRAGRETAARGRE